MVFINKSSGKLINGNVYHVEEIGSDLFYNKFFWIDGCGYILKTNFISLKEYRIKKLLKIKSI